MKELIFCLLMGHLQPPIASEVKSFTLFKYKNVEYVMMVERWECSRCKKSKFDKRFFMKVSMELW